MVDDALKTLQQLANFHRHQIKTKIIAIGGSNGKTTTKELISRVLETTFKTYSTKGNLNNHIGVPLSLLSIHAETEFAVIEMGANHLGETKLLCEMAEPDFGLITNNGRDHLEGYGSIENVRKGNGELFDYLRMKNRIAFVCADQKDLMKMSEGMNRITYGENEAATYTGKIINSFPFLQLQTSNLQLQTQLIGKYNFDNVMAAVCIGKYFGVADEKLRKSIESYSPSNNRSQILKSGTNTFILDAYNANPSSMEAALENFRSIPGNNKIVILGDMAELGEATRSEHEAIVHSLQSANLAKVILIGKEFKNADQNSGSGFLHFENVSEVKEWFSKQNFENSYFLLKASRVIGLEKLLE